MASDLLSIATSGAKAARLALDVTAQNIANASSEGYVRRTIKLEELSSTGGIGRIGDLSLSGVRLAGVVRNADVFRQAEVRRTGADAARGQAEVAGLENIQTAVEQSNVYPSIVKFEASLQQLASDPVDPSLRAAVIESARTMTRTFNIAASSLDSAGSGMRFEAADAVSQVNTLAGELARVNLRLARASDATSDQTALLDQRDSLMQQMSQFADVSTKINADHTVEVRLGGTAGPQIVAGGSATPLTMATGPTGTISFALGASAVSLTGGSLAGKARRWSSSLMCAASSTPLPAASLPRSIRRKPMASRSMAVRARTFSPAPTPRQWRWPSRMAPRSPPLLRLPAPTAAIQAISPRCATASPPPIRPARWTR